MSKIAKGVGKVFKKVGKFVMKVAPYALAAAAVVFTGGAALGLGFAAGGFSGAVGGVITSLGIKGAVAGALTGAITGAGSGAAIGGLLGGKRGMRQGFIAGGLTGGALGALSPGSVGIVKEGGQWTTRAALNKAGTAVANAAGNPATIGSNVPRPDMGLAPGTGTTPGTATVGMNAGGGIPALDSWTVPRPAGVPLASVSRGVAPAIGGGGMVPGGTQQVFQQGVQQGTQQAGRGVMGFLNANPGLSGQILQSVGGALGGGEESSRKTFNNRADAEIRINRSRTDDELRARAAAGAQAYGGVYAGRPDPFNIAGSASTASSGIPATGVPPTRSRWWFNPQTNQVEEVRV